MLAGLQPFIDVTGQDKYGQPMTIGGSAYYLRTQLESVIRDPASAQQLDTALAVAVNHGVAPQPTFK
jgi:hypothetical protein